MSDNYLAKGTHLKGKDDYTIERVLGRGGFGVTYSATAYNGNIRHYYAIKEFFPLDICQRQGNMVIASDKSQYDCGLKSFLEEAKRFNSGVVRHCNIVGINEVFKANGTAYYVMEYVSGKTIKGYLSVTREGKAWEEDEAITILTPVMNALSLLHSKRFTHLDIKPENIVLSPVDGSDELRPVLVDFGLAQHYDANGDMTSTIKMRAGTYGYSPCEQFMPEGMQRFSPESDVYSLAATLLYMLTGKDPLPATEITADIINSSLPESVSSKTRSAIINAMKMSRSERTSSVTEFAKHLGVTIDVDSGIKTVILPDNDDSDWLMKKLRLVMKKLRLVIGVIVGAAIIFTVVNKCYFPGGKPGPDIDTTLQDTALQDSADVQKGMTTNNSDTTSIEEKTTQVKEGGHSSNQPTSPRPKQGTLNLGYAKWRGGVLKGEPDGVGRLTFTSSYNYEGVSVKAGYYSDATYEEGVLLGAIVYDESGTIIKKIVP